jgi:hypothetical protein
MDPSMDRKIALIVEDLEAADGGAAEDTGLSALDALLRSLVPYVEPAAAERDAAPLRQFCQLQDTFDHNLTAALLHVYRRLAAAPRSAAAEAELLQCNRLLQGLLLLHPPSRNLFARRANMALILAFLRPTPAQPAPAQPAPTPPTPPAASAAPAVAPLTPPFPTATAAALLVLTLIHILLKNLPNFRTFEQCDGCALVISHLNLVALARAGAAAGAADTQQLLNFKLIEFLVFYLVDESQNFAPGAQTRLVAAKIDLFRGAFPEIGLLVENLADLKNM